MGKNTARMIGRWNTQSTREPWGGGAQYLSVFKYIYNVLPSDIYQLMFACITPWAPFLRLHDRHISVIAQSQEKCVAMVDSWVPYHDELHELWVVAFWKQCLGPQHRLNCMSEAQKRSWNQECDEGIRVEGTEKIIDREEVLHVGSNPDEKALYVNAMIISSKPWVTDSQWRNWQRGVTLAEREE